MAAIVLRRARIVNFLYFVTNGTFPRILRHKILYVPPSFRDWGIVLNEVRRKFMSSRPLYKLCWKCQTLLDEKQFVCACCECLQQPNVQINYFQLLQVPETFDLDVSELMKNFKNMQRKFHPDKYGQKSKTEQDYSAIYSAFINKAYQTLLKPYTRGMYILELRGKSLNEEKITLPPDFLMAIMELNEQLVADQSVEAVEKLIKTNYVEIETRMTKLSKAIKTQDWENAQIILAEMKYYSNIDDKARIILNKHEISASMT